MGMSAFETYPSSFAEYQQRNRDEIASGRVQGDPRLPEPIVAAGNVFTGNLPVSKHDKSGITMAEHLEIATEMKDDGLHMLITVPQALAEFMTSRVATADLGVPRVVEERYENPDGSDIVVDTDLAGQHRKALDNAGPLAGLHAGVNDIVVWKK